MDRFIKLTTEAPLDHPLVKAWFNGVLAYAPSGIVHAISVTDDDNTRHVVRLVHQTHPEGHSYVIPLTRDLRPSEIDAIVAQFADEQPELDFDVETNETRLRTRDHDEIPIDAAKHLALCLAMAKQKHEAWVRERTSAGWRYGIAFDPQDKTHPLLRPWDQLPKRYQAPDLNWPQQLLALLNDNGYIVIAREDLDRMTANDQSKPRNINRF